MCSTHQCAGFFRVLIVKWREGEQQGGAYIDRTPADLKLAYREWKKFADYSRASMKASE